MKGKFLFSIGLLGLLCLMLPGSLRADGFGLTFFDQGYAGGGRVTSPGYPGYPDPSFPGSHWVAFNAPQLSASDSWSITDPLHPAAPFYSATSTFSGSISNGVLHAYSQTTGDGAYNGTDLFFFDTFNFSGPTGQTGQYLITFTLHGTEIMNGTSADNINQLLVAENGTLGAGLGLPGIIGTIVAPGTGSVVINAAAGESDTLGLDLEIRNLNNTNANINPVGTITIDDSNTGYFTVTPLTPGFNYNTASGLSYLNPPATATPEPSSLLLLGTGLVGLWALAARRKRHAPPTPC